MTFTVHFTCLLIAFIFFVLAGFNIPTDGKVSFRDLGYASVTAAFLFT